MEADGLTQSWTSGTHSLPIMVATKGFNDVFGYTAGVSETS